MRFLLLLALCLSALVLHGVVVRAASGVQSTMGIVNGKGEVRLDPSVQHIPLQPELQQLRPPPARIPAAFDIFVGLSVFRDGYRCAKTIFTGFKRARNPDRLYFGVVDQVNEGDDKCIVEFCKMAAAEWPEYGACRFREHIRIDERTADASRGPTLARHYQQKLLRNEEFCLQLDSHSIFTNNWDENIVADWKQINNEMAVLTTYLHHIHDFVDDDGNNHVPGSLPHLCTTIRGGNGLVRNEGASMISGSKIPQLTALWGAGLSFSKCHAERRVLVDSHTLWMFDGEEFLRSSHLWTYGYDLYSPSPLGSVVYHNYSKAPARFENVKVDQKQKEKETEMGNNRFKLIVGQPFKGPVDALEMDKFAYGTVRSFQTYLNFSGVTFEEGKTDQASCEQLHWVPYEKPEEVEKIVGGGWALYPTPQEPEPPRNHVEPMAEDPENDGPVEPQLQDKHAEHGAGGDEPKEAKLREEPVGGVPSGADKADAVAGSGGVFYMVFFVGVFAYVAFSNEDLRRQCGSRN
ncbi:hypothetical protein Poli38472_011045 [Pythium oligandrum]|uniref:GlcNac transferase n=1 Tax=Pythium oligandrum TaxID=41045 RepID=A0A8K1FKR9_PYTOL|nr:hypothetical protein Poli38472_011045 [Pythium oligandrum]|eukprot:TMW67425.1 hypothetical protein Poli38472_011045 [Pythium oligandrum]